MDLHRIDATDEYLNGAYDEDGNGVYCDQCSGEMRFRRGKWVCEDCGRTMTRSEFFNYIGAEPSKCECSSSCSENYPICRNWCDK